MTVSPRHENSVARIRELARSQGHLVLINDQSRGKDGYALDPIDCPDGIRRQFIIDCLVRHRMGAMLAFEVEFNKDVTAVKRWALRQRFIILIPSPPSSVDEWVKDPKLFEEEIAYWIRHFALGDKVVLEARKSQ